MPRGSLLHMKIALPVSAFAAALVATTAFAQTPATPAQVIAAAPAADWQAIPAQDLLIVKTETGEVMVEIDRLPAVVMHRARSGAVGPGGEAVAHQPLEGDTNAVETLGREGDVERRGRKAGAR